MRGRQTDTSPASPHFILSTNIFTRKQVSTLCATSVNSLPKKGKPRTAYTIWHGYTTSALVTNQHPVVF